MTYGKSVTLSRAVSYQRNRNVVSYQANKKGFGPVANGVVVILILCMLGLVYLTQITKTNALGYTMNDLSSKQETLQEEYSGLELEAVRLQNLDRIKNSNVAKTLETAQPTAYSAQ